MSNMLPHEIIFFSNILMYCLLKYNILLYYYTFGSLEKLLDLDWFIWKPRKITNIFERIEKHNSKRYIPISTYIQIFFANRIWYVSKGIYFFGRPDMSLTF